MRIPDVWITPKHRRGRSDVVEWHSARELVQRVAWLSQPLVYWSDAAPTFEPQHVAYRPLTHLIAERLATLAPGVYAVQIASPQVSVVSVTRITSEHIGTAAAAIGLSKRYPKAMPKLVGDVDAWRAAIERRLQVVGAAVQAAASLGKQRGETLAIEELCLWIGPDELRPSRTLSTEAIHAWLIDTAKTAAPGQRAGAIVWGQRRVRCDVPPRLATWMQVGSTLSRWSPDVICRLLTDERNASQLTQLTRSLPALNSEEVALAALEYHHAAGKNLRAFFAALPPLFSAWDRICEEPRRRWEMVLELIHQAFLAAADVPRRWHRPFNEALARLLRETCEARGLNGKVEEGSPYKHLHAFFQRLLGVPPEWIESLNLKCRLSEFQSQVLAQRSGTHLFTREEDAAINYEREIPLFAKWYFDGMESFDWWVTKVPPIEDGGRSLQNPDSSGLDSQSAQADFVTAALDFNRGSTLTEAIIDHLKDSNEANNWNEREATLRALIWLGDDAAPILQEAKNLAYLSDEQLKLIRQHTQSSRVRTERVEG
jgi:hypothetical protein